MDHIDPDHPLHDELRWHQRNSLPSGVKEIEFDLFTDVAKRLNEEKADSTPSHLSSAPPVEGSAISVIEAISRDLKHFRNCQSLDILELLQELKETIEAEPDAASFSGRLKNEFTACHLVLNERFATAEKGVPAPAFRPQPARSKAPKGNAVELANTVRLIDLHYCWCAGHRPQQNAISAATFGAEFDFDAADRFARSKGKSLKKLELIELHDTFGPQHCRLGNVTLLHATDRSSQRVFHRARARYNIDLQNRSLKAGVDKREWADLLAIGTMLKHLDIPIDGNTLKQMTRLIGRHISDRPFRHKEKYVSACKKLGLDVE